MRVLVTGGFGYLGAQVARRFSERGADVRVLDRGMLAEHVTWARERGIEVVLGDVTDPPSLVGVCEGVDAVVHTAALNQPSCAADPALGLSVNALGTRNVLAEAGEAGVARFIYLSSIHVYGSLKGETVDETRPPRPVTDYGVTKLAGEGYCHEFAAAGCIEVAALRPANGFGPPVFASADCWMLAVNDFCRTAFETGEISLNSAGTQRRDFLALSDTVSAIETLVDAPRIGADGAAGVYNAGAGLSLTIRGLAREAASVCAEVYGREIAVRLPEGSEDIPDDAPVDYRFARLAALGFAPATDLRAGIRAVAEFVAAMES
jgi:UDP-glucose 4-epimerase